MQICDTDHKSLFILMQYYITLHGITLLFRFCTIFRSLIMHICDSDHIIMCTLIKYIIKYKCNFIFYYTIFFFYSVFMSLPN